MHRDKKSDGPSACAESVEVQGQSQTEKNLQLEDSSLHDTELELTTKSVTSSKDEMIEEEFDENELSKLKEFLEETELETGADGAVEGEWSVHVKDSKDKHSHLYFFGRTGRDKHEWFRRINTAISEANAASSAESSTTEDKAPSDVTPVETKEGVEMAVYKVSEKDTVAFAKAPSKTIDSISESVTIAPPIAPLVPDMESYEKSFWPYLYKIIQSKNSPGCQCGMLPAEVTWVNTIVARMMYDVMRDPHIIGRLQNRIQRKLNTLKLPSFMSPLLVTELSLVGACPLVGGVAAPTCDERGLWLDADFRYDGGATIAILTQINLMKLKEKNVTLEEQLLSTAENIVENEMNTTTSGILFSEKQLRKRKPAIFESDVEDSAESSSDEETPPTHPPDIDDPLPPPDYVPATTEGGSSKKKFLRMVDKIATNKYFQQVTEYKYVKRAMEGLSNTDIKLQLEVCALQGRLALNLPPPPHDRLWFGFRTNPQLVLKARPAVGARALRFAHISNWIEQKLSREFEKVLVLPNMEDILIGVLTPTPVQYE